ncbi:transposase, partial [Shigella flexneri]
ASTLKSPSYTKSVSWQHYQKKRRSVERRIIVTSWDNVS